MNTKMNKEMNTKMNTENPIPSVYFSAHDLHAYYGESYIVQGVSLNLDEGEILALLGRNGAGKTSTLRAIARMDNPALHRGEVWLNNEPLHLVESWQAAQSGVSLVPEDRRIIQGLSVEENIMLAQIKPPIGWSLERIYELFPVWANAAVRKARRFQGANSKCWRLGGLWLGILNCCCWMNLMRDSRP